MIGKHDPRLQADPQQTASYGAAPERRADGGGLRRFLGGAPAAVLVKLVVLSVVVGAAMAMLGLTPGLLFWRLHEAALWLIEMGLATFHDFGQWILAGAVVVVPLWLISRLLAMGR